MNIVLWKLVMHCKVFGFLFVFSPFHQTDGPGVYLTSVSEEYAHAARTFGFSKKDLWHLSVASIDFIFAPESVKNKLRERWQEAFPHDP